ncbi:inorganic triphosphatase YgiF [Saccharomonospora amisosensis]|uniref:Inorganic triphosphatase YgiF n=1 Tax=Saccharomonospora amisosensis TaxID=1128677 RepID=A0A7X5UNM0_9PSEU|nr:CYTH domain-containing protein [Saccharomonospora amisosensis]NIJ11330.1 inorganic triphosphatase YgiF [Saccharomonospora amisosensis]
MIEREIKFELELDRPVPRLDGIGPVARQADPVRSVLEATYFDTHDHRLLGAGITLRRRTGGADAGWHLKLPHASGHREELAEPLGDTGDALPRNLADRVREHGRGADLVPVVRIRTTRYSYALLDADDHVVATLMDDHVTSEGGGDPPGPDSWRELEVELAETSGDELLRTFSGALRRFGARPARWPSKLSRALRRPASG